MMDVLAEVVRVPERNGPDDASGAEDGDGSAAVADPDADFYDAHPNRFLHGARLSVFACLLCLVKSQENAYAVAREGVVVDALIGVSRRRGSPSHARAMAVLAHLTRQAKNCHHLVFKHASLVPALHGRDGIVRPGGGAVRILRSAEPERRQELQGADRAHAGGHTEPDGPAEEGAGRRGGRTAERGQQR